jgi:hypothetical protein
MSETASNLWVGSGKDFSSSYPRITRFTQRFARGTALSFGEQEKSFPVVSGT